MKKSLSLLLAIAMVFSMFATVVSANELTTMEKYEFLKKEGIFEGTDGDLPALEDAMTRAQFAKVLTLLNGLSEDSAAAAGYTDLLGAGWATGFIGAVTKAGLMEGTWDVPLQFTPSGEVKIEELAATLVRTFDLTLVNEPVNGNVSNWAVEYVATAVKAGLISEQGDYTVAAKRGLLVEATYNAYNQINVPAELSIQDVKAVGAKKVEVTFNKAVEDTKEIKVVLNRGSNAVTLAENNGTAWNDAKTKLVFNTSVPMTQGTYTVVLSTDNKDIELGTTSKDINVENEKVESIRFVNASDILPQADSVSVDFEAVNQYGEKATFPASNFQVHSSNQAVAANAANDRQSVYVRINDAIENDALQRGSYLSLTIIGENGAVSANKTFQIGDVQTVGKISLNELVLQDDKERLEAGDYAYIDYDAQDQYGHTISDLGTLEDYVFLSSTYPAAFESQDGIAFVQEGTANRDLPVLRIQTTSQFSYNQEITIHAVAAGTGQSSQLKLTVSTPKIPHEVSFGEFNETVAVGDDAVNIPLVVKSEHGETLSATDVANAVANGDIFVYGSHPGVAAVDFGSGANRGNVELTPQGLKGNVTITVMIPRSQKSATYTVSVQEERYPSDVYISSALKAKLLDRSTSSLKLKFRDQYGKEISKEKLQEYSNDYFVRTYVQRTSGGSGSYSIEATTSNLAELAHLVPNGYVDSDLDVINDTNITFKAVSEEAQRYSFRAELFKVQENNNTSVVDSVSTNFETITNEAAKSLTYEVKSLDNGIYYAFHEDAFGGATVSETTYQKYQAKLEVTAKDSAGREVALPADAVRSAYTSDSSKADTVDRDGWKVFGKAKGNVDITVTYTPAAGSSFASTLNDVVVSDIKPSAQSFTAANNNKSVDWDTNLAGNLKVWDDQLLGELKVKDQYGVELKNAELWNDAVVMGKISVTASEVDGSGTVSIDSETGDLTVNGTVNSFKLTATTVNGRSVSVTVNR